MKKTKTEQVTILDTILFFSLIFLTSVISSALVFTGFYYKFIDKFYIGDSTSYQRGYDNGQYNYSFLITKFARNCYDAKNNNVKKDEDYLRFYDITNFGEIASVNLSCEDVLHNYRSEDLIIGPMNENKQNK